MYDPLAAVILTANNLGSGGSWGSSGGFTVVYDDSIRIGCSIWLIPGIPTSLLCRIIFYCMFYRRTVSIWWVGPLIPLPCWQSPMRDWFERLVGLIISNSLGELLKLLAFNKMDRSIRISGLILRCPLSYWAADPTSEGDVWFKPILYESRVSNKEKIMPMNRLKSRKYTTAWCSAV